MKKILVSACFLGANVRYDGVVKALDHQRLLKWRKEGRLISVCPEVAGGLPTPRAPAELQPKSSLIVDNLGVDVTNAFLHGAKHALQLCRMHGIKYALLKEYSPSCGSEQIYDGSFNQQKINGMGVTARLLKENDITVYSELTLGELIKIVD
ncbi:DUF523 domain-containing protein [Thalassotalea atypica]|uniref:DUF523 domain-containing protein n=1 Tax=Thalassotalea atypica TaxID=2054316 RepID=UPI002573DD2C|nr:DUF523 domain-containing protein [Thalassotalea atypica]